MSSQGSEFNIASKPCVGEASPVDELGVSHATSSQNFRWKYEHALEKSDLPAMTCWLLCRIAARADVKTGMICGKYMPSEKALAAATHMSLRSVREHLKIAEKRKWLIVEHREGRKSCLALAIPEGIATASETMRTPADDAPTPADPAGGTPADPAPVSDRSAQIVKPQTKDHHDARPRETIPPVDNSMRMMIIAELETLTGETIPEAHALKVEAQILGRASSPPSHPIPFVRSAIRREGNPKNFLPSWTPPNYRQAPPVDDGGYWAAHAEQSPRECREDPVQLGDTFGAIRAMMPQGRTLW